MFHERVREYFSFTRKERIGVLVLMFFILLIFIFPYFFELKKNKSDQQSLDKFKNEIAQLKLKQQNENAKRASSGINRDEDDNSVYNDPMPQTARKNSLFYFDPNNISEQQWEQLGIRNKTIHTIQHYLEKGGKFKIPSDLKKVYGIGDDDYNRLLPFIKIKNAPNTDKTDSIAVVIKKDYPSSIHKATEVSIVDINTADSVSFIALRGIGSKLASRIVHFRETLGGFYAIEQIAEIYGLPDSVFQAIRPFLRIKNDSVTKIDINTADLKTLKQHPYIRWELARSIIQYRNQHGPFKNPQDLLQLAILTPENYRKILPYVKIN